MARNGRTKIASPVAPDAVPRPFPQNLAALIAEMALELAKLQAAATSIVIGST